MQTPRNPWHARLQQSPTQEDMPKLDKVQGAWELVSADKGASLTAVAVGTARIAEAPVVAAHTGGRAFQGTGRALSAAAGRLSYVYSLKASPPLII